MSRCYEFFLNAWNALSSFPSGLLLLIFFFFNTWFKNLIPEASWAFLDWMSNSLLFTHNALYIFLCGNTMLYYNYLLNYSSVLLPTHWDWASGISNRTSIPNTWQRAWHFVCPPCFMNEWTNYSLIVLHYQWMVHFTGHKNHLEFLL